MILFFSEREENVKVDIFNAYTALLRQTRPAMASRSAAASAKVGAVPSLSAAGGVGSGLQADTAMEQEEDTVALLKTQVKRHIGYLICIILWINFILINFMIW